MNAEPMELTVEEENDRLLVHSHGRHHTIMNLLRQAVWDVGGKAGYDRGHEYTGDATLVVEGDDPGQVLQEAIGHAADELDAFQNAFNNA